MHRLLQNELKRWKHQKEHYPLLIRGARQVGKSYLVETFAKSDFKNSATINFELQPQMKSCFATYDPKEIIGKIQLLLSVQIKEGETLLFLDEIQECPEAIIALRYFKEKMPMLHVIGAGSLLEFALSNSKLKMPVGRVHFLYLEPLSFSEFLIASGNSNLYEHLKIASLKIPFDAAVHEKLLEILRLYLILGGMPAVLNEYFEEGDFLSCQKIQAGILQTYRSDFGKYAKSAEHKYLQKVFDAVPRLASDRIKFSNIDPDIKSRDLKEAIQLLSLAGIITPVHAVSASGLPLGADVNEKKFKVIFLDTGLMQNTCGLNARLAVEKDFMQINSGAVAEQFVGQELKAYADKYQPHNLYFWVRDEKSSMAEVDYVISIEDGIYPIEVKAGRTGKLKSLKLFMEQKRSRLGIRISQEKLSYFDNILSVPLYMIEQIQRLARSV